MGGNTYQETANDVIVRCPNGETPISSTYNSTTQRVSAAFKSLSCENCPHKAKRRPRQTENGLKIDISSKTIHRAKEIALRSTEEFKNLSKLRNGVETIPSLLRNRYHVDRMPVRGKTKTKFFFGCMIGAINFRKLYRFRQGSGNYAKNPIITKNAG